MKMKNLKTGTCLIVLGNILYLAYIKFSSGKSNSNFADFSNGFLLGISIACNLVGIIMFVKYILKNNSK
jgi:hypothetical protein